MPRAAREKSESGIYHIMLRGINRQEIFHDDKDCLKFLKTLERYKKQNSIKVYGWCLMGNHVHLLLGEGKEDISITIKRIGVSFVWYYNWKYRRTGHLFQDRFKSEKVDSDEYLLTVIRYIHQNPVKVLMVKKCADWKWSSCTGYYGKNSYPAGLLDKELILGMLSEKIDIATKTFKEFNEDDNDDKCLDDSVNTRLTDAEALIEIKKLIPGFEITEIMSLSKPERDKIISRIKGIEGLTQRQAARILGVSPNMIFKA